LTGDRFARSEAEKKNGAGERRGKKYKNDSAEDDILVCVEWEMS
jgi:hypothetical protein